MRRLGYNMINIELNCHYRNNHHLLTITNTSNKSTPNTTTASATNTTVPPIAVNPGSRDPPDFRQGVVGGRRGVVRGRGRS